MGDDKLEAITAIKDMEQEGFIAASLTRSGWRVIYRATSREKFLESLSAYPDALLIVSDDFISHYELGGRSHILLRGRSQPISEMGTSNPCSDFELNELVRSQRSNKLSSYSVIPATRKTVIAAASVQGGVGTTTIAINIADQVSTRGRTLLVDGVSGNGIIAEHFEVHNIRTHPKELSEKLSLFEISELSQLRYLAKIAADFDFIVIDLGILREGNFEGFRVQDQIAQWVAHSRGKIILASDSYRQSVERSIKLCRKMCKAVPSIVVEPVVILDSPWSRRARLSFEKEFTQLHNLHPTLITRDRKSAQETRERATTLRFGAPKSPINRELARFAFDRLIQE